MIQIKPEERTSAPRRRFWSGLLLGYFGMALFLASMLLLGPAVQQDRDNLVYVLGALAGWTLILHAIYRR